MITLDWDDAKGKLTKMRSKETEADYRYFREPDLLPIHMTDEWREAILADFPELPLARRTRFIEDYKLSVYDANVLTSERSLSDYFENAVKAYGGEAKKIANWVMNDLMRAMNADWQRERLQKFTGVSVDALPVYEAGQALKRNHSRPHRCEAAWICSAKS